jgi:serine/threonine protein kinase
MAEGKAVSDDFFIIIDRLCETLDDRMDAWREEVKKHHNKRSIFGPSSKCKQLSEQLLVNRLTVAYDLAAAFWYLHEHKLVYRDIKPANIGFDHRGMFSFGYLLRYHSKYTNLNILYHVTTNR